MAFSNKMQSNLGKQGYIDNSYLENSFSFYYIDI